MIVTIKNASDVTKFGGKAANLAILIKGGFKVPSGWAISHDGFDTKGHLLEAEKLQLDLNKLYAVRSSATVEDADDKSWAGQFETYLFVEPKDVIKRAEQCHATSKTRTKAYAKEAGKTDVFQVAVIVQEMVDPAFAGVLFSKNPVTGADQMVVEYVKGIGEKLVSGKTTPELIEWDRKTALKTSKKTAPFSAEELFETGLNIESTYSDVPQDIEWAIDKTGQLWLTQSRPITTLDIQHTGKGLHFLGDPESLFYWGPAAARPLYMSDFLAAEQENFKFLYESPLYPNPPKTLFLFHDNKSLWLNKTTAFVDFCVAVFEAYMQHGNIEEDRESWRSATSKIHENKSYEADDLLELLTNSWRPTLIAEIALYGAENSIHMLLSKYSEEDQKRIWGTFTLPDKPTFINEIDRDVLAINDPEKLAEKYDWSLNSYAGVAKPESLKKYYTQRIKDLQGNDQIYTGSDNKRKELAAELKINKETIKKLDLTRHIAEFMDERKSWMMKSRKQIQVMVHNLAEKTKQDILHLENCRLEDLAIERYEEYYGWTYLKGENLQLEKVDVEKSWEWYVEYRAAESVLKGIVSSRGGHHFLSGEVVVVHNPSEQVPDGKVVVVPSTGPSFIPIMRRAAALITDHGGMMSHAAIVAREFNLPCIVGTVHATKILKNGDKVVLDLVNGIVMSGSKSA